MQLDVPQWSTVSPRALAVGSLAFWLLFGRKTSVLRILGICAVAGAAVHLLGQVL